MNPNAPKPCATCGDEGKITCPACSMVPYCSEICRARSLYQHKTHCEGLLQQLVERLGEILREIFYVFSERAYTLKISSIAKGSDVVMVSEGSNNLRVSNQALFPFPAEMLPDLSDRHAVLGVGRSEHALAYLHDFIAQMLKGMPVSRVEEAEFHMLRAPRAGVLRCADANGNRHVQDPQQHRVLQLVASVHGKRWILDPTGRTYGIPTQAMAAPNYVRRYTNLSLGQPNVYGFGYHKSKFQDCARVKGLGGLPYTVSFLAADHLQLGLDEWMLRSHLTPPEMLRLLEELFDAHLVSLRTCVHDMMSSIRTSSEYRQLVQDALNA
ncbi:hypothetical protein HBH43_120970 [Parastagonospora nodorum]|nr:hypothetical protein HBH43_120970 [Parastagonospora nodorum]KAH5119443.1 hypothetical protein HBH71_078240 [Parastagonospora nodorum]